MVQQTIRSQQMRRNSLRTGACIQTRRMARQPLMRSMYQARLLLIAPMATSMRTVDIGAFPSRSVSPEAAATQNTSATGRRNVIIPHPRRQPLIQGATRHHLQPHPRRLMRSMYQARLLLLAPMATSMRTVDIGAFPSRSVSPEAAATQNTSATGRRNVIHAQGATRHHLQPHRRRTAPVGTGTRIVDTGALPGSNARPWAAAILRT